MKKRKKLTTSMFLAMLSDEQQERDDLSVKPIERIDSSSVKMFNVGSKTFFKFHNSGVIEQYQERLNSKFFSGIEVSQSAFAYVKHKSYIGMFESHRYGYYFLRIDIKSFFHSISRQLIKSALAGYVSDEYFIKDEQKLIDALVNVVMLHVTEEGSEFINKDILPIGFKSSPVISNIIFRKFDYFIQSLCSKNNIVYTRYADDMMFSSPVGFKFIHTKKFMDELSYILSLGGFCINNKKTLKNKCMFTLNGYVIENRGISGETASIRISNKKTAIISKLINKLKYNIDSKVIMKKLFELSESKVKSKIKYAGKKGEFVDNYYNSQLVNVMSGYRAYLISILKFHEKFNCIEKKYIDKYQEMVNSLEKYLLIRK